MPQAVALQPKPVLPSNKDSTWVLEDPQRLVFYYSLDEQILVIGCHSGGIGSSSTTGSVFASFEETAGRWH